MKNIIEKKKKPFSKQNSTQNTKKRLGNNLINYMNIHFSSCRNEFLFFLMKWLNYQIFQKTQVQYLPRFLYKIRDKIQNLYQNLRKYIPCCFCLYECVLKCFFIQVLFSSQKHHPLVLYQPEAFLRYLAYLYYTTGASF